MVTLTRRTAFSEECAPIALTHGVNCSKRNMHFDLPCAGRQFKVGSAVKCADPLDGERALQPVRPNALAYARIPHPINSAIAFATAPNSSAWSRWSELTVRCSCNGTSYSYGKNRSTAPFGRVEWR